MESEKLFIGRDLLYLAFLFLGAGLGCFLNRYRLRAKKAYRDRSVTIGLVMLSGTVAVFAISLIVTGGKLFTDPRFYYTGMILSLFPLLSFRFPRAAGFPVIILAGLATVWTAYSFSQYPRFDLVPANMGNIEIGTDRQVVLNVLPDKSSAGFFLEHDSKPELTITSFEYAVFIPVIGGEQRGKITEFRNSGIVIYEDNRFERGLLGEWLCIFQPDGFFGERDFGSVHKRTVQMPDGLLFPGSVARIFYNGVFVIIK